MSEKVHVQRIKNSGTKLWGSLGVLDYTREQFRRNYKHIECSIRMILIAGDDDTAKASHSNDMHHQYLNISSQPHLHNNIAGITGGYNKYTASKVLHMNNRVIHGGRIGYIIYV